MAKMPHGSFEAWIRARAGGCVEPDLIDELCKASFDFGSGEYVFCNAGVQAQWEAWQAAIEMKNNLESGVCECHERDSSYVCEYCYSLGYRGHMQE